MANKIMEFQLFTSTISKVSSTQRVQTLLEITLSLRVFEINDTFTFHQNSRWQPKSCYKINAFLHFTQKFKMATKKWRESDLCKMWPVHSADTLWVQNFCRNRSIPHRFRGECSFMQKFKRVAKSGGKVIFAKKLPVDSAYILCAEKFRRNRSILHSKGDRSKFVFLQF